MLNKSKLWAVVLLVAVFAAGIVLGTAVSAAANDGGRRGSRDGSRRQGGYVDRLERELQLAPAQRGSVEHILDRYQDSMEVLWTSMRPRMDSIRAAVRNDILAALDSAQQVRYQQFIHHTDSARSARARESRHDRR